LWWSLFWAPSTNFIPPAVSSAQAPVTGRFSPKDNMVSVYVPKGEFTMGSDSSQSQQSAKPAHIVNLDAFWIDQTEVTNGMYVKCIQDNGCTPPKYYTGKAVDTGNQYTIPNAKVLLYENYLLPETANLPVLNVSWDQAQSYCTWAGRQLPTEAQWEKAARGTDGRTYPWGEQMPDRTLLNNYYEGPVQIGSYPDGASPYGALDMAGNVWEYVSDWYDRGYYASSPQDNPTGPASGESHVVRGGAWYTVQKVMTFYRAFEGSSDLSLSRIGFRCSSPN
jgi:eukaryotic-like serine/threonine-protein kinase